MRSKVAGCHSPFGMHVCTDMRMETYIDMCAGTCMNMCIDTCMDMFGCATNRLGMRACNQVPKPVLNVCMEICTDSLGSSGIGLVDWACWVRP